MVEWEQLGNVTGRHLHLECATSQAWQCATFVNPCEKLGIPNQDDLIIKYDGSIPPIPPTPTNKNSIKWLKSSSRFSFSGLKRIWKTVPKSPWVKILKMKI